METKIDTQYENERVFFLFNSCALDKHHSFYSLNKEQAKQLLDRINYISSMTWKQFANLPREQGLTSEKQNTNSFNLIHQQNPLEEKIAEQYYFHFRVKPSQPFRVFGYQYKQFFHITHLDPKGKVHGH